ncbi:uncharacterized protein [Lolium perenne]|uniref:uncharacterized protein isoform X2 n=1 Tax=Lolium perenne TaxID=4522 RepID=UPI0021F523E7|nr:uncharacterized protein LOC127311615 isoform X2 [Lolium perenne]
MTRKKMHVVESNEEYLVEEQIEQQNCVEKIQESSDHQVITTSNDEEGSTDCDDDADNDEGTKGRKKRKLKYIWNLPVGKRIVVKCNDLDQPIGKEAKHLGNFLGTIARNGSLCSLSYKDWRLLIGEKDKETNMRFLYPSRLEPYILKTIRDRWRQHKSDMKALYFNDKKSIEANYSNGPSCVSPDQWRALVNNWTSQKAKDISAQNRENCGKRKSTHTAGTKSFSRNREELREQDPEKKYPHRAVLYIHTHKPISKDNKKINAHVARLKGILEEQPELADTSQGKTAWKGDALNIVLGDEKSGHVHGLGLVPNPNKVLDVSTSRRFQNIQFTSLEDIPNEAMLSLSVEMEKIGQYVKNQGAEMLELKEKIRELEREPDQRSLEIMELKEKIRELERGPNQRSLNLVPTLRDDPPVDGHNSKRKRVYGTSPSKQLPMVKEPNNLMIKQSGFPDLDSQSSIKPATQDKNKESLVQNGNAQQGEKNAAVHNNMKTTPLQSEKQRVTGVSTSVKHDFKSRNSKVANAPVLSNKQQSGSVSWLGAGLLPAGTKVFLKSLASGNKDVALATIVSTDPKYKLDGAEITNQFWAVHVIAALVKTEELVRKRKNCTTLGNAEGTKIAWPSTFIQKING